MLTFFINTAGIFILDVLSLWMVIRYYKKIPSGKILLYFLFFLLSTYLWVHFTLTARYPYLPDGIRMSMIEIAYAVSFIFVNSLVYFIFAIGGILDKNIRNPLFLFFQALSAVFFVLSFTDWIISGVNYGDKILQMDYGILYPYSVIFYLLYFVFAFYQTLTAMRKSEEQVLKIQLLYIIISASVMSAVSLFGVSIIPLIFKGAPSIMLGQMSVLAIFFAISYILINGKVLILDRQYRILRNSFAKEADDDQLFRLQKLFTALQVEFRNENERLPEHLKRDSSKKLLSLPLKDGIGEVREINFEEIVPLQQLPQNSVGILTEKELLKGSDWIEPEDYENFIMSHEERCRASFGNSIICLSKNFYSLVMDTVRHASANFPLLFYGEIGTSRKGLAEIAHHSRNGKKIAEISCHAVSEYEFKRRVTVFLEQPDRSEDGLLLAGIENLKPSGYDFLETFLSNQSNGFYIYFTASPRIFKSGEFLEHPVYQTLKKFSIETIPFRNRKEDIFFLILKTILGFNRSSRTYKIKKISRSFMEKALSLWWSGNAFEIERVIVKEILDSDDGVLEKFTSKGSEPVPANHERLTPLEEGEKVVIHECLLKNNYNKTKTKNELGISVNTLNTKIEKYGIPVF